LASHTWRHHNPIRRCRDRQADALLRVQGIRWRLRPADLHHIAHPAKTIEVATMNLDGPPAAVLADVRRIADRVRAWRAAGEGCRC
jgi:hypothetical protein